MADSYRPNLTPDDVTAVCALYGLSVESQTEIPGYDDQNISVKDASGRRAFLKVSHGETAAQRDRVALQTAGALHMAANGVAVAKMLPLLEPPEPTTPTTDPAAFLAHYTSPASGKPVCARLIDFVEGKMLADVSYSDRTLEAFGAEMGRAAAGLSTFTFPHPTTGRPSHTPCEPSVPQPLPDGWDALDWPPHVWDTQNALQARSRLPSVKNADTHALMVKIFDEFETVGLPGLGKCRRGWIHGDLNDRNVIMKPKDATAGDGDGDGDKDHVVAAFIDFEDMVYSFLVTDLSVALAYVCLSGLPSYKSPSAAAAAAAASAGADPLQLPINLCCAVLRGYSSTHSLSADELAVLPLLIQTRLATSVTMALHTISLEPENEEYLSVHSKPGLEVLQLLDAAGASVMLTAFQEACGGGGKK